MTAKHRFVDDQRKPYLIALGTDFILSGLLKGATIERMRQANREHCDPPLLWKDVPAYYAAAAKKAEAQGNTNLCDMEAEVGAGAAVNETDADVVANVLQKARELYELEARMAQLQNLLAPVMERHKVLINEELPEAMREAGVGDEFPLSNGWKVQRRARLVASLPTPSGIARERDQEARVKMQERLAGALDYLVKTGNQGIIKDQFQINLGKGETNRAKGIENFLTKRGIPFVHDKTVHPQTLGAFVREQVREGTDIPMELFGAHEVATVKLVAPKNNA